MIQAKNISFSYGDLQVLNEINLNIEKGEFISIVGASGSGKSTLLQLLGTLEHVDSGEIFINNKSVHKISEKKLARFRNQHIGFVFQFHNLLAEFTAIENVCLPALIANKRYKDAEKDAFKILRMLDLQNRLYHKPSELSGGEQQRVAVARALINSPSIILADEPSGNLDSKHADELHKLLLKLNRENGQTTIVVTHNSEFANIADRKFEIIDGKLNV